MRLHEPLGLVATMLRNGCDDRRMFVVGGFDTITFGEVQLSDDANPLGDAGMDSVQFGIARSNHQLVMKLFGEDP